MFKGRRQLGWGEAMDSLLGRHGPWVKPPKAL